MKKQLQTLLILLALIAGISCSKNGQSPVTPPKPAYIKDTSAAIYFRLVPVAINDIKLFFFHNDLLKKISQSVCPSPSFTSLV